MVKFVLLPFLVMRQSCLICAAAGKYRTAAVTDEGDVYMWEGLSKQHSHQKSAKSASLPPRPDKAARHKLLMSETIAPER